MDKTLIERIHEAQAEIENRGRAVVLLLAMGEEGRTLRSRKVISLIKTLESTSTTITALVSSEDRKNLYQVIIPVHRRQGGQEVCRGGTCTCYDNGKKGACKHVLAVATHWLTVYGKDWTRLKNAEEALTLRED